MKLKKHKNGTYSITGITLQQLQLLFHPHNVVTFTNNLPAELRADSDAIYNALVNGGYHSNEFNCSIAEAMEKV